MFVRSPVSAHQYLKQTISAAIVVHRLWPAAGDQGNPVPNSGTENATNIKTNIYQVTSFVD